MKGLLREDGGHRALPGLIEDAYRSITDPGGWTVFLGHLAHAVDGVMPGIAVDEPRPQAQALECPEKAIRAFEEHYAPRIGRLARRESMFGAWCYSDVESPVLDELLSDWARPLGVGEALSTHALLGRSLIGFGVYRETGASPFSPEDRLLVDRLTPHVARALDLSRRLEDVTVRHGLLTSALDHTTLALVLVDPDGKVLEMTSAARRLLCCKDGVCVAEGRLLAAAREPARRLGELVRGAARTGDGRGFDSGGSLRLPRPSDRRPLEAHVSPLPGDRVRLGRERGCAAVFLSDPEAAPSALHDRLAELHGLTPAEARLAARLCRGQSLSDVADELELSKETLRNQLKAVYAKTQTRRQGELVALLLRGLSPTIGDAPQGEP